MTRMKQHTYKILIYASMNVMFKSRRIFKYFNDINKFFNIRMST